MDLFFTGEKYQHIACRQLFVNFNAFVYRLSYIVCRSYFREEVRHGEHSRLNFGDGRCRTEEYLIIEVLHSQSS
jgi:hypothetical protein